ncbi:uncharacterized protein YMR152W [Kluyveromyces marxianus]|nr:uncharacterized protein YMR152W [Kluyveromyces marxianus]
MVLNRALTYVDNSSPLTIIENEIDLDKCYKDNEIVIRVHAAAFNPVDFILHDLANKWIAGSKPKTIGRDFSGVIVKAGSKVSKDWAVGDKVCGLFDALYNEQGTVRDYLVLDPEGSRAKLLTKLPEFHDSQYSDFELGAAWPLVFGTALEGFTEYGQKFTDKSNVLVLGASTSVGYHVAKIAKQLYNVHAVVGTCNSKSFERNKEVGYDYLVAYDTEDIPSRLKEIVKNELNGEKFDLIYDCTGYQGLIPEINEYLKPKSENSQYITICGKAKHDFNTKTPIRTAIGNMLAGFGALRYSFNYHMLMLKTDRKIPVAFHELVKKGNYKPPIDSVLSLEEFKVAETKMRKYGAKGKIIIKLE